MIIMKRFWIVLITAFAVNSPLSAQSGTQDHLTVAVVAPVSGNWGSYGSEIVQGAQIAIDDLKESYGPLRLQVEDACLAADTVKAASKLIEFDHIKAVVGSYCVVGMVPMAGILERHKIIGFHSSAVADEILNAGEFVFTTNVTIANEAKALASYAYNNLGARRAAVLFLLTQWGQNYSKYFSEEFSKLGGTVVSSFENPIGAVDFRTELLKISNSKPDVLFIAHVGAELGTALKQARQAGLTVPILGAHEAEEQSVLEVAGAAADDLTFLSPRLPRTTTVYKKFRDHYRQKYSSEPGILASNAYDATTIVIQKLRECRLDTTCAKNKIYEIKNFPGTSGVFSITSEGGTVKDFVRKSAKSGSFKEAT